MYSGSDFMKKGFDDGVYHIKEIQDIIIAIN